MTRLKLYLHEARKDVIQTLSWHRDFFTSALVVSTLAILSYLDILIINPISPSLAAAIFTVIIGTIGTLFSILTLYGEVIATASGKDRQRKNYLRHLKNTFAIPVNTAVAGFVIAIMSNSYRINQNIVGDINIVLSPEEWFSLLMTLLLLYSIFSFKEAFSFIIEVVIRKESTETIEEDRQDTNESEESKT